MILCHMVKLLMYVFKTLYYVCLLFTWRFPDLDIHDLFSTNPPLFIISTEKGTSLTFFTQIGICHPLI